MPKRTAVAVVAAALASACLAAPAALAQERAYELVSPPDSDGRVLPGSGASTPDGNVVCFDGEGAAAGAQPNGLLTADGYCSWRTDSGWETKWVTGPAVPEARGGYGSAVFFLSPDGERVVFSSDKGIYPDFPGSDAPVNQRATQSAFMWEGGAMPRWLAPTPEPLEEPNNGSRDPAAASEDLRHGVFESGLSLVPQDTNDDHDVYEWTPDGIRLVSRDDSGAATGGTVPLHTENFGADSGLAQPGVVSRDGSRIFFHVDITVPGPGIQTRRTVFMREGDELTLVSPRRGGDAPLPILFAGASDDGEVVYLQTQEQLTPEPKEAGTALYRYEVATDTLSLVATDPTGVWFLGVSADGSTLVYRTGNFVTGPWDLRVVRDGVETTLGELGAGDNSGVADTVGNPSAARRALRMSPDGSAVVFSSYGSFAGVPAGTKRVYVWTPDDGVRLVSKRAGGSPPDGDAAVGNYSFDGDGSDPRTVTLANSVHEYPLLGRVLADDGRVFFETAEQLVAGDVNGYIDVYEWRDGAVSLVSPGTQREHAFYHDNSADGKTVFFTTVARVIPELDRNATSDLYAARVGGGFPLPESAECEGDGCQGAGPSVPVRERAATEDFHGSGNVKRARGVGRARLAVGRLSKAQRRRLARRGRAAVRVRASRRGRVRLVARARIAGRARVVARSSRVVGAKKPVRMRLRLSRRARRALRERNGLRLVIKVRHSKSRASVRRVVVLRG